MIVISVLSFLGPLAVVVYGLQLVSRTLFRLLEHRLKRWYLDPNLNTITALVSGWLGTLITLSPVSNRLFLASLQDLGALEKRRVYPLLLGTYLGTALIVWGFVPTVLLGQWALLGLVLATLGLPFFQSYILMRNTWGDLVMGWGLVFLGLELLNGGPVLLGRDPEAMALIRWVSSRGGGQIFFALAGIALGVIFRSNLGAPVLAMTLGYRGWLSLEAGLLMVAASFAGSLVEPLLFLNNVNLRGKISILVQIQSHVLASLSGVLILPLFNLGYHYWSSSRAEDVASYPFWVAAYLSVLVLLTIVVVLPALPLLERLSSRLANQLSHRVSQSQLSHSMESNLLAYRSRASQLLEGTYGLLLALMDLTQSPKLKNETTERFQTLSERFKENLSTYQHNLAQSLRYQITQHQARELQTLQAFGVNIETIEQLLERIFRIVSKHITHRGFFFQKIIRILYRFLSYLLDIERYNQDLLQGQTWDQEVPVIDDLIHSIHNLRRKIKSAIQKLLKKSSRSVRHLVAQLEVLELLHNIVHLEKTVGVLFASLNEKGPETKSRSLGGANIKNDQPPRTT